MAIPSYVWFLMLIGGAIALLQSTWKRRSKRFEDHEYHVDKVPEQEVYDFAFELHRMTKDHFDLNSCVELAQVLCAVDGFQKSHYTMKEAIGRGAFIASALRHIREDGATPRVLSRIQAAARVALPPQPEDHRWN